MKYRHEWKHSINNADTLVLRKRLAAVMQRDTHARDGKYSVRSLYFDTPTDKALREKVDGVDRREKWRIRLYDGDTSYIVLEKKSKVNGLCSKQQCPVSADEVNKILSGDLSWMMTCDRPLCVELYAKMRSQQLRPKTIVEYTREPFVYKPGNTRVTIDYDIRTGHYVGEFLSPFIVSLPAADDTIILEVKWDEYLPDIIRDLVTIPGRRVEAFSKYAASRRFG